MYIWIFEKRKQSIGEYIYLEIERIYHKIMIEFILLLLWIPEKKRENLYLEIFDLLYRTSEYYMYMREIYYYSIYMEEKCEILSNQIEWYMVYANKKIFETTVVFSFLYSFIFTWKSYRSQIICWNSPLTGYVEEFPLTEEYTMQNTLCKYLWSNENRMMFCEYIRTF